MQHEQGTGVSTNRSITEAIIYLNKCNSTVIETGAKTTMANHRDQQMAISPFPPPSYHMKNKAFAAFLQSKGDATFHLLEIAPIPKWHGK
jgi:hypothetical protein